MRIALLGAGLAGLAAARRLHAAGASVRLYDKGRAPGGRVATRRAGAGQFDHGAQYFSARGESFAAALREAQAAPWPDATRFVGTPSMSALPRALAAGLNIAFSRQIIGLVRDGTAWRVRHADAASVRPGQTQTDAPVEEDGPFDTVALTCPAPQAAPLIAAHRADWAGRLAATVAAPCWTVLLRFGERLDLPDTLRPEGSAIGWAARDSAKPGREAGAECWVVQASAAWSRANLEAPPEAVTDALLAALAPRLPAPEFAAAHRWRYALVETPLGEPCLADPALGLALGGDWCVGPRGEAAWISGEALAEALLAR
jgi:renalase